MNDGASSVLCCALRATRLASDGTTPAGSSNAYVTDQAISLEMKRVVEGGIDQSVLDATGGIYTAVKDKDPIKRFDLGLIMGRPMWELTEILVGGSLLTSAGAAIGYVPPAVGASPNNGVCLELWSKAVVNGDLATTRPYIRWVFPKTFFDLPEGNLESADFQGSYSGWCAENPNAGNGPWNDWPAGAGGLRFSFRDNTIPTAVSDYLTVPTQV